MCHQLTPALANETTWGLGLARFEQKWPAARVSPLSATEWLNFKSDVFHIRETVKEMMP